MKYVRLVLDAGGREREVHPMYDRLANAEYVDRATAMHWTYSGEELSVMHYVEGDATRFRADVDPIPEVVDYELTTAGEGAFYVYVRGVATDPVRELFDGLDRSPAIVIPPVEFAPDGTVSYSVFGPAADVQRAVDGVPDPIEVTVTEVSSIEATPGVLESLLSDRQREAITAALSLGYYEIPREADHEDVASAIDCAPSTAAEHLRKAEATVIRSALET